MGRRATRRINMPITKRLIQAVLAGALALGLSGAALADKQTRNTVIGAGLGGVAGALLSDGDPWLTLGGAAAGGVLGHVITDDDDRRGRRHWDRDRGRGDSYRRAGYRGHDGYRGHGRGNGRGNGHYRH
jgi:osmotically inducible lipoprotein OsmB